MKITRYFIDKPRTLFLIDAIGALLTSVMLYLVLPRLLPWFGMPERVLLPLALIAFSYFWYSLACAVFLRKRWKAFLRVIIVGNVMYCCLTLLLVVLHWHSLTVLGLGYFTLEMLVIMALVALEIATLNAGTEITPKQEI